MQRIRYKYRGIRVLEIQIWGGTQVQLNGLMEMIAQLDESAEYKRLFLKYIRYCDMCYSEASKCLEGIWMPLFGKEYRLCPTVCFRSREITGEAVKFFKKILELRSTAINAEKNIES